MPKVYISGALTGIQDPEEVKLFYEKLGSLCEGIGFKSHIPHNFTDPLKNPDISPKTVFETDKYQVSHSDLVIAYIGVPSLGVGMELAYAEVYNIPLVLLYEKGKIVSRFPRGIPTVIAEIQFESYEDALLKLGIYLKQWISKTST